MPRSDRAIPADEAEAEALVALRKALLPIKGTAVTPEIALGRLEKAGFCLRRNEVAKPDEEGVHVYYGFPFRWSESYAPQLRAVATMIDKGEAVITRMLVVFQYYGVAENEDGYEIRTGMINDAPR